MIIANEIRYGLDKKLYKIQGYLCKKYPDAVIYGQLHENDREQGKILEWPLLEKEVFVDDREEMVIGFRVLNKNINDFLGIANIDIICSLKTDNREYTEELFYKHLIKCGYITKINNLKIGITQVFTGLYNDNIKYRDIYPFHIFAYNTDINFAYDICV